MNKENICVVRGVFSNLYYWGEGWSRATKELWDDYLTNYKGIYWKPVLIKDTWYLVSTQGSIFLHPMDFRAVLKSSGGKCPRGHDDDLEDYFGGELDELATLCSELAERCGGKLATLQVEQQRVENNNLKDWLKRS